MATTAQLAKIHIAKKELNLDDDLYRDILAFNFNGKTSAKELNSNEARGLLDIFVAKGWKQKKAKGRGPKRSSTFVKIEPGPYAKRQRKILAMWNELGYAIEKLHARCKKQWKVERFEWLKDDHALHVLITDLQERLENKGERR